MDRKNLIIAVLVGLLVLGSLWGQVGDKNAKALRHELEQAEEQLSIVESTNSQTHDAVLTKTADLQKTLQGKEQQLNKARKELVSLRKTNKGLEARVSELESTVHKLSNVEQQPAPAAPKGDSEQVARLKAKIGALEKKLKSGQHKVAPAQSAVIIQLADAQKKILALNKELKEKDRLLARKNTEEVNAVAGGLQEKIDTLQDELKKKDEQLVLAGKSAVRIIDLEKQLSELQGEKGSAVVEGVTPIQFAYFQSALKKKDMQLAQAMRVVADLEKQVAGLEIQQKKEAGQANVKQFVRVQTHEKNKKGAPQKKTICLQARPDTPKQRVQDEKDRGAIITDLRNQISILKAELNDKNEQLAGKGVQSAEISEQVISHLQKTIKTLKDELKEKDTRYNKARSACGDYIADLKTKLTGLTVEIQSRGERIATLEKEIKAGTKVEKKQVADCQDVARLEKELAAARDINTKLEQAVKSVKQAQTAQVGSSGDIETAKAQILGLEKIVEEKNVIIDELSRNLDKVKINMDVLLNKISEQQEGLQGVQDTNRELVKELTAKNAEVADLQEEIRKGQGQKQ